MIVKISAGRSGSRRNQRSRRSAFLTSSGSTPTTSTRVSRFGISAVVTARFVSLARPPGAELFRQFKQEAAPAHTVRGPNPNTNYIQLMPLTSTKQITGLPQRQLPGKHQALHPPSAILRLQMRFPGCIGYRCPGILGYLRTGRQEDLGEAWFQGSLG